MSILFYHYETDLKVTGSELNISAVTVEDAGTYECQANNNVPPAAFGQMRLQILCKSFEFTAFILQCQRVEGI